MIANTRWVEHEGKKILLHEYPGAAVKPYIDEVQELSAAIVAQGEDNILLLLDAKDAHVDNKDIGAFKKATQNIEPFCQKISVFGLDPLQKFFMSLVTPMLSLNVKAVKTAQDAMDWLAE